MYTPATVVDVGTYVWLHIEMVKYYVIELAAGERLKLHCN